MITREHLYLLWALFILGLCGYFVARHIYNHKKANAKPLICPARFDCTAVIHSDYSKFAGIPLEVLGMIYYSIISIFFLYVIFVPQELSVIGVSLIALVTMGAFLMSLYLLGIQLFVLKKGCLWCSFSSIISVLIFGGTIYAFGIIDIVRMWMNV